MSMLLRTFNTKKKEPMLKIFNTCFKGKLNIDALCGPPVEQTWIYELRTWLLGKIKKTKYVQPRKNKREVYDNIIIYGCQQLERLKENILILDTNWIRDRWIIIPKIPREQMVNFYQE